MWIKKLFNRSSSREESPVTSIDMVKVRRIQELAAQMDMMDPMLASVGELAIANRYASVSETQKHLRLGYARSSYIIDQLEELEIVGPFEKKPRDVLVTAEEWKLIKPYLSDTLPF